MRQQRDCAINIQFGIDCSKNIYHRINHHRVLLAKPEFHECKSWININEEISNSL